MNQAQQARAQAFQRAQTFLTTHADTLGSVTTAAAHTTFAGVVTAIAAQAAAQYGALEAATGYTQLRDQLRETLRFVHMRPIADIARTALAGAPDIVQLRLPPTEMKDARLIEAGTAMATRSAPYKDTFTAYGMPDDFVEQLQAATEAVRKAVADRAAARNTLVFATTDLEYQLMLGRNALRVVDSLVVAQLRSTNPVLIAAWNQAKHVIAKPGVPRGSNRAAVGVATPSSTPPDAAPDIMPVETAPSVRAA